MAEKVVGDAQFEVDFLLLGWGGDYQPLLQDLIDLFQIPDLRAALGEPFPESANHPTFKVFALDEKRAQIDQGFRHVSFSTVRRPCNTRQAGFVMGRYQ
jgi:hypothetical protein